MIVIIQAAVVVSAQIAVVMEGANIFPLSAETVPLWGPEQPADRPDD